MVLRDALGRFARAETVPEPEGKPLSAGALAVLRALPDIAGVAEPGEVLLGVECEPKHHLVLFWPLLCQSDTSWDRAELWELGAPTLYDIDLTVPSDKGANSFEGDKWHNHMAHPVRMRMGEGGAYKSQGYHTACFDSYASYQRVTKNLDNRPGSICRGDAWFSNDPMQATLALRMWHVQTQENYAAVANRSVSSAWWKKHGKGFLKEYPEAQVIVVPSRTLGIERALYVPLDPAWVERSIAHDFRKPMPYVPVTEVKEIPQPDGVLIR